MICDGWGALHAEATNRYTGEMSEYQGEPTWLHLWMSTHVYDGEYHPARAWSEWDYVLTSRTGNAAAATAMVTGVKTRNGRVSVDADASGRLLAIGEVARGLGMALGAVTTVPVSHATPGAFTSHNESRQNAYAIAAEALSDAWLVRHRPHSSLAILVDLVEPPCSDRINDKGDASDI